VKATEGSSYTSPVFTAQINTAIGRGKLVGAYHFASGGNATAEADHFLSVVGPYVGRAVLVLDMEANALKRGAGWAKQFLDRVFARVHVTPVIYGSTGNICTAAYAGVAASYPLWAAAYPSPAPTGFGVHTPARTSPWPFATLYQYTSSGRLPGYGGALDLNIFYGDASAWLTMAADPATPDPDPFSEDDEMLSPEAQAFVTNAINAAVGNAVDKLADDIRRDARHRVFKNQATGELIAVKFAPGVLHANDGEGQVSSWYANYELVGDSPAQAKVLTDAQFKTLLALADGTDSAYTKEESK